MLNAELPEGRTRISDAVIQKLAIAEAHAVAGVLDVRGIVVGAIVGGAAGGVVGMVEAGPVGLSLGVASGSAAGAAAGHYISDQQRRRKFFSADGAKPPSVRMRLTAVYGADLASLANEVRSRVRRVVQRVAGLTEVVVDVEFVEVVKLP